MSAPIAKLILETLPHETELLEEQKPEFNREKENRK